jgi:hypothetical protein
MNVRFNAVARLIAKNPSYSCHARPGPKTGPARLLPSGLAVLFCLGLLWAPGKALAEEPWVPGGQGGHDWLYARAFLGPAFGNGSYLMPEPDLGAKPKDLDLAFKGGGVVYGVEGSVALFRYLTVGLGVWGVWLPLQGIESHNPADFAASQYESWGGTGLTNWNRQIWVLGPTIGFFVSKPWDLYLSLGIGLNPFLLDGTVENCMAATLGSELMTRKVDLQRFKTLSLGVALQLARWQVDYPWVDFTDAAKTSRVNFTTLGLTLVAILD